MRFALGLCLISTACAAPPAPPPEPTTPPPAVFHEQPVDASAEMGIQPGVCPVELDEFPSLYFEDRVLVRLPQGVTMDDFPEFTPGVFARSTRPITSGTCHENGATVEFMAMAILGDVQPQPDHPLGRIRDETLEAFGYPEESALVEWEENPATRSGMWVYEIPPRPGGAEPAKILLALRTGRGIVVAVVFETHPDAWPMLVNTFVASAKHVSIAAP